MPSFSNICYWRNCCVFTKFKYIFFKAVLILKTNYLSLFKNVFMNKLYKDATEKKNLNSLHAISKRISLFLIALIAFSGFLQAQNVTIGASNYTTLKGAFDAINAGTHTGAVIVNVNLNTTETAMAVLNSSGTGAASYTSVLVRPTANVTVSGNLGNAVIQLLGADNVTIDGLNGASQLTVNNTYQQLSKTTQFD